MCNQEFKRPRERAIVRATRLIIARAERERERERERGRILWPNRPCSEPKCNGHFAANLALTLGAGMHLGWVLSKVLVYCIYVRYLDPQGKLGRIMEREEREEYLRLLTHVLT